MTESTDYQPLALTFDNVRKARELAVDALRAMITRANISNKTVVQLARISLRSSASPSTVFPGIAELVGTIEMLDRMVALPIDPPGTKYDAGYEKRAMETLQARERARAARQAPHLKLVE